MAVWCAQYESCGGRDLYCLSSDEQQVAAVETGSPRALAVGSSLSNSTKQTDTSEQKIPYPKNLVDFFAGLEYNIYVADATEIIRVLRHRKRESYIRVLRRRKRESYIRVLRRRERDL